MYAGIEPKLETYTLVPEEEVKPVSIPISITDEEKNDENVLLQVDNVPDTYDETLDQRVSQYDNVINDA